jgi:hypothetical protein
MVPNFSSQLWKERLNSKTQQFHQYQHNEQSPLTEHKKKRNKKSPGLGHVQTYGGVDHLIVS